MPPGERSAYEWYGNGKLWTTLPPSGRLGEGLAFIDEDGSTRHKHPWWRGVPGRVVVTGTRVDAPAPELVGRTSDGYGDTGFREPSSQASLSPSLDPRPDEFTCPMMKTGRPFRAESRRIRGDRRLTLRRRAKRQKRAQPAAKRSNRRRRKNGLN